MATTKKNLRVVVSHNFVRTKTKSNVKTHGNELELSYRQLDLF